MTGLLSGEVFDSFLLAEASLHTSVLWQTDGHLNRAFYSDSEWEDHENRPYDLVQWQEVRPFFRELIKGRKAPSAFRFVLHLKPEAVKELLQSSQLDSDTERIAAMVLTVRYEKASLTLLSGLSVRSFAIDKSADRLWDDAVQAFLSRREIAFEPLS